MRYLKLNNKNWKRLCKHEIEAEQQKMNFKEEGQLKMAIDKTGGKEYEK